MLLTSPSTTTYPHYSNHLKLTPIPNRNHFISQPISIFAFARDFGGNYAISPAIPNYATPNGRHVSGQISIHAIARENGDFGGNDSNSTVPSPSIFHFTARNRHHFISKPISIRAIANKNGDFGGNESNSAVTDDVGTKGSGTTARGRRLLKVREEKRKREYDRVHNYPAWAKVLENACKDDTELRAVLGDSIGNPELMKKKVEERVRQKGPSFSKSKTGSVLAFKVSFRDFNPIDSYIWFELYGSPSDRDVELIGSVIQSWYVMGRLGAFNSSNLQLGNSSMEYDPLYDADKGSKVLPSSFHDISDVEFQDNWGRVRVDLGTSDILAIDVLLNCLTVLSSEYVGIQQVVFGGRRMGDWEDGMTSPEFGYKYFKM